MKLRTRKAGVGVVLGCLLAVGSMSPPLGAAQSDPSWRTGGDSRACSAPISFDKVSPRAPGVGRRVLVIGDSITRNSRTILTKALRKSGWNPTIRCFGGKRLDWGMSQIRDQRRWKGLPETVIIALGTNDMRWIDKATTKARIGKILDQLGPKRLVLWINLYGNNGDRFSKSKQAWFNKTLDKAASGRPNVHVLPWASRAKAADFLMSGPIHYTYKGRVLRTKLTVSYLNRLFEETPPGI